MAYLKGKICSRFQSGKLKTLFKVPFRGSNLSMFILVIVSLCSSKKSGKIKTAYKMDYLNLNCDVDFDFAGPTVHGAAVLG